MKKGVQRALCCPRALGHDASVTIQHESLPWVRSPVGAFSRGALWDKVSPFTARFRSQSAPPHRGSSRRANLGDLELDGTIIFMPLGGSSLVLWSDRLMGLNRPEFHLYDRDTPPPLPAAHQADVDRVNRRGNCRAFSTNKNFSSIESSNRALLSILNRTADRAFKKCPVQ